MSQASPVEIRSAEESDADAIAAVAAAAWRADYPDVLHRENVEDAAGEWYEPEEMASSLTDPRTVAFVACRDDEVIGFVHAFDDQEGERDESSAADGYVFRVYVHPDHRDSGVGRDLVDATIEALHDRGCESVRANVLAENEAGQAFYDALGFEREGVTGETEVGGDYYEEVSYVRHRT